MKLLHKMVVADCCVCIDDMCRFTMLGAGVLEHLTAGPQADPHGQVQLDMMD